MPRKKKFSDADIAKIDGMTMYAATCLEVANEFNTSTATIVRLIKQLHKTTFAEYSKKKQGSIRFRLKQKAIRMALEGDKTMIIFCLKNLCGWGDNPNVIEDVEEEGYPELAPL